MASQDVVLPRVLAVVVGLSACCTSAVATCPEDLDANGNIGFNDLLQILSVWGDCPGCPEDLSGNGSADFNDVLAVLSAWGDCPSKDVVDMQLVGRPLDAYPYIQRTDAFLDGDTIFFALDPAHAPVDPVDVYITTNRSVADWTADPTLVDVRGLPQTETFTGTTILANRRALQASHLLEADGGLAFGVGYDLVLDMNKNGMLDGADLIDGLEAGAGFSVFVDPHNAGPLSVTTTSYAVANGSVPNGFESERVYYPTSIASMGELPLVVISHGNGHVYTWYDYLGEHLASWGYVVMTHENDTVPGIETASVTTFEHTDAFLGQLGGIAGGVLNGHIDVRRIAWLGHSRGGEGVVRAYTQVRDGQAGVTNYTADDIILVSSIAPVTFLSSVESDPGDVNYHLLWGSADGDVSGGAASPGTWGFALLERATGFRQSTYIHGADHNDFNSDGFNDFNGPGGTQIGREEAQRVTKALYVPLLKRYLELAENAEEFMWRQSEDLRSPSVAGTTTTVREYREADAVRGRVIDDFQSNPALGMSAIGGTVTFDVTNAVESTMEESNETYTWTTSDPMNGMSRTLGGADPRGLVFDWSPGTARFIEFEVPASDRDFSLFEAITLRATQGTRHPQTTAETGDLTFNVTLRDGAGVSRSINIGAYDGGIEEPYARSGGWQNEFETVRVRLDAFTLTETAGAAVIDLTDIVAVRLDFGLGTGSTRGRLAIDDLYLSNGAAPEVPGGLRMNLPTGAPTLVSPFGPTTFPVDLSAFAETLVPGSATLWYRTTATSSFISAPLTSLGGTAFEATLPAFLCTDTPSFYLEAEGSMSGVVRLPAGAPTATFTATVAVETVLLSDSFETNLGWTTSDDGDATSGFWQRGDPVDDPNWEYDPTSDADGSGLCYLTENGAGNTDVDNGAVTLTSPVLDLSAAGVEVAYEYYLRLTVVTGEDRLLVEAEHGDGVWRPVVSHDTNGGLTWRPHVITAADLVAAGVIPGATVRLRFTAVDAGQQSIVEAGLDAFVVRTLTCTD